MCGGVRTRVVEVFFVIAQSKSPNLSPVASLPLGTSAPFAALLPAGFRRQMLAVFLWDGAA